jgi:hypothetical protein
VAIECSLPVSFQLVVVCFEAARSPVRLAKIRHSLRLVSDRFHFFEFMEGGSMIVSSLLPPSPQIHCHHECDKSRIT